MLTRALFIANSDINSDISIWQINLAICLPPAATAPPTALKAHLAAPAFFLLPSLLQYRFQRIREVISAFLREAKRGFDLENIQVVTRRLHDDAKFKQSVT